jgi:DKNYY family
MGLLSFLFGCDSKSPFEKRDGVWYYHEQAIADADGRTFVVLSDHYAKDARRVYYCRTYRESSDYFLTRRNRVTVIEGADAPTFRYLDQGDQGYARDTARVYFEGVRFAVKDLATFTVLEYGFAKDRITGYFHQEPVAGSDGSTFTFLDNHYSKDSAHAFYSWIATGKDGGAPQRKTLRITGAHAGTFAALEDGYASDSAQVYYEGKPLTKDPGSFRVLSFGYAAAKDGVYYYGAQIPGADPSTFSIMDMPTDSADARDATATYKQGLRTSTPARP